MYLETFYIVSKVISTIGLISIIGLIFIVLNLIKLHKRIKRGKRISKVYSDLSRWMDCFKGLPNKNDLLTEYVTDILKIDGTLSDEELDEILDIITMKYQNYIPELKQLSRDRKLSKILK